MTICLASTWQPRGEFPRLQKLLPQLQQAYHWMVIVLPPDTDQTLVDAVDGMPSVKAVRAKDWSAGRRIALQEALETSAAYIQYVDLDRLLRWIETRPEEWRKTLEVMQRSDYLVIGRTPAAYDTHPQAMVRTEALSNQVVSYLLGKRMDFSAGSKGFSRRAAEFVTANCEAGSPFGADGEWSILLQRGGFHVDYLPVDGLDWEIPDQHQSQAADLERQGQVAQAYDADPRNWERRLAVAQEVIEAGFQAVRRPISQPAQATVDTRQPDFDFEAVFDVDDYMYFYGDDLTDELSDRQTSFLVEWLELSSPAKILDLACGFGRHANRLAALGHQVTGVDASPGFIEMARSDAQTRGVQVDYRQADMRQVEFHSEFDHVLNLFTAFGYFSDKENFQVLKNVAQALKPVGLFALDIQNRDAMVKAMLPYFVTEKEGNLMIDRLHIDLLTSRMVNRRIVIRDGIRRDKPNFVRLYTYSEIHSLLQQVGMEIYKTFGGWNGQSLSPESRRMIIIARKL